MICTDAPFHQFHILELTLLSQDLPNVFSDLLKEDFSTKFRDEYDMITTIPAGVG